MEVRSDKGQLCGECGLPCELGVKFLNARSPTCGGCVASALGILQRARADAAKPKAIPARMEGVRSVIRDLKDLR
jgi:hypothetical protein